MQGVSQQPMRDRLAGQCTEQLNLSSDPLSGLRRRSSTDLVNMLVNSDAVAFHDFQVKNGTKFIAAVHDRTISVYDLNGTAQSVIFDPASADYLATPDNIKFGTLNNDTYVVNKEVVPAMEGGITSYRNYGANDEGIIQVIGGAYGRKYSIKINGLEVASYSTPDGSAPGHVVEASPNFIAIKLVQAIQAYTSTILPFFDGGSTIFLQALNQQFTLSGTDDAGGTNMKVTKDYINRVEDLPPKAVGGYVVRVASKADPEADVWYQFKNTVIDPDALKPVDGYWQEVAANGIKYRINKATMPHVLSYDPNSTTFTFGTVSWKDRQVGTDLSNPLPSFIDNPINDVTSFQSRLVFLSGASVTMSKTNVPEDFFFTSATALADTDTIDISSTSVQGALISAVPHNRDLVIFSKKAQFIIFGRSVLTSKNAALVLTTSFEAELTAKPVPAGRNVFFTTAYGRFTGIREFYTEGSTDINDSRPITQHVKEYVRGTAIKMAASSNYETLLTLTDDDSRNLYIYQYIWSDNQKVQSAWSTWSFHADIKYMFFDQELIYIIAKTGREYFLYRLSLDQVDSESVGFPVYMDSRFDVDSAHTEFALPYSALSDKELLVAQGVGCPNPGMPVRIVSRVFDPALGWVCTLRNDMRGGKLVVGIPFTSRYIPTQPMVKDSDGVKVGTGFLTIKSFLVSLSRSAMIFARVLTKWGDTPPIKFDGRIIGETENKVGQVALSDAVFEVPIREKSDNAEFAISSDGYYPMTLLDIEWKGQYNKKGRRITIGGSAG